MEAGPGGRKVWWVWWWGVVVGVMMCGGETEVCGWEASAVVRRYKRERGKAGRMKKQAKRIIHMQKSAREEVNKLDIS